MTNDVLDELFRLALSENVRNGYRQTNNYRRQEEPTVIRPKVDSAFADTHDQHAYTMHDTSASRANTDASDMETDVDQLRKALMRQIEETNRMTHLYTDATKKISYLENENAAYKAQLEKFYKIQAIMNGDAT